MIPDEIKARFLHEYIKSSNLEAIRSEIAAGLRGPAGPPADFRVHMIAALEAVAAEIWDAATEAQADYDWFAERGRAQGMSDPQENNPYREKTSR